MKPTPCGRWCHVSCAQWIPETSFGDADAMTPVVGVDNVTVERLSLRCGLCKQPNGACIQCAGGKACYATYHPLCARRRGYRMVALEPDPALRLDASAVTHLADGVVLASFCPRCAFKAPGGGEAPGVWRTKAKPPTKPRARLPRARAFAGMHHAPGSGDGGAPALDGLRAQPLDWSLRRSRREPAALAAAAAKRAFVAATPHRVTGARRIGGELPVRCGQVCDACTWSHAPGAPAPQPPLSLAERYARMRITAATRLTCGKSAVHGLGAFAVTDHAANDLIIEYTGELLRPAVADAREAGSYNTLVGAGTYLFRRESDVVDATRSGGLAHLINHSCKLRAFCEDPQIPMIH